jgi:hypothetical protein
VGTDRRCLIVALVCDENFDCGGFCFEMDVVRRHHHQNICELNGDVNKTVVEGRDRSYDVSIPSDFHHKHNDAYGNNADAKPSRNTILV